VATTSSTLLTNNIDSRETRPILPPSVALGARHANSVSEMPTTKAKKIKMNTPRFGSAANALGSQGKKVHNGNIGLYLFMFVLGICALIIYLFIAQ
jgi:hypothetical protein